ncbi:MAG: glyoxalase [Nitriliruptorales bacterium]|nr:glyoxalase [Nitriliruptorales bacterium]
MTDPLDALRQPVEPVEPDAAFAADLRARLERALLDPRGAIMSDQTATAPAELAWPPALTPYLAVADARRAIDWYVEVFGAERRGEPYVMPDGRIGHAELGIGDAVLMLADEFPEEGVTGPQGERGASHSIFAQVPDVDTTIERAVDRGAALTRPVANEPYGRAGVINDPFGHRWMVVTPPASASRSRHGDIAYVTMGVPDARRARDFYGAVLGWRFSPGSVEQGWQVENTTPMAGLAGGRQAEIQLCYRVADIHAAAARVREHGGQAEEPVAKPYGRLTECTDDQGARFQLWSS